MSDKRNYNRYNVSLEGLACSVTTDKSTGVDLSDLSCSGVGVVSKEKLSKGQLVELEIAVPADDIPIFAAGEVAWVVKEEFLDNQYRAGIKLSKIHENDKRRIASFIHSKFIKYDDL